MRITGLWLFSDNVTNAVLRASAEDGPQALSALLTLTRKSTARRRLLTMTDKVKSALCRSCGHEG